MELPNPALNHQYGRCLGQQDFENYFQGIPQRIWRVANRGHEIEIRSSGDLNTDHWTKLPQLPNTLGIAIPKVVKSPRYFSIASEVPFRGVPFAGGWLTGVDWGEFGGAVIWIDDEGKQGRVLYARNPIDLIPARDGVLILMGLRHLMKSGSAVFLNPRDLLPHNELPHPIDLGNAPITAVLNRDDNLAGFFILTDDGIREIVADWNDGRYYDQRFAVTTLQPDLDSLGANSMAIEARTGTIYIGATDHVVAIERADSLGSLTRSSSTERWFAPAHCVRMEKVDSHCRCRTAAGDELMQLVNLPLTP